MVLKRNFSPEFPSSNFLSVQSLLLNLIKGTCIDLIMVLEALLTSREPHEK